MMDTLLVILFYFIPAIIAGGRGHGNAGAIFALNLLLGWTIIFWLGALIWAFTDNVKSEVK